MKKLSKNGPVEVIENKGVRIPIYLSPRRGEESYVIAYYANGARKRERLPTLQAAKAQAKKKVEELASGTVHVGSYSATETAAIESAISILSPTGLSITQAASEVAEGVKILNGGGSIVDACRFYVEQAARRDIPPKKFKDVVEEFLSSISPPNGSFRYWQDCSSRLGGAAAQLGDRNISDIRVCDLESYLDNIRRRVVTKDGVKVGLKSEAKKATGRNRNNYRGALCTLFSFARKKEYLPRGVQTEAEFILVAKEVDQDIGIYTPDELQKILQNLEPRWIPFASIAAFGGARAAEIHRLDWEDIDLANGHITIAKSKSKTSTRRIVPIPPCLAAWLKPHAKVNGPLTPRYSQDATLLAEFGKSFKRSGVRSQHNGFRHSFASYRLAQTQSAAQVALEMGTSVRKLMENYRELVPANKGQTWFDVFPPSPKNTRASRGSVAKKGSSNLRTVKKPVLPKA